MTKWYGSLNNRMEEGRQFVETIEVGTGVTEYNYSDRRAYEVVAVIDQKHISIREFDHIRKGECFSNDWDLISNPNNRVIDLVKRGQNWYEAKTATIEDVNSEDPERRLWVALNGFDFDKIRSKGKQTKFYKRNISIGVADYYYDYSF